MSDAPSESITILHLSDLHAGQRFKKDGFSERTIADRCDRLLELFVRYTFGTLGVPQVDLLVLSLSLIHI